MSDPESAARAAQQDTPDVARWSATGWWGACAIALAIALFYLLLTPWTTLWDRDEPRFAQAAVEMLRSGHYLVPTFNGEVRPQKPILIYWLMTLSLRLFGTGELAVRFWAPVGIGLAALFTYAAGRRLASPRVGLAAMLILAVNPLVLLEGTAATTDAVLLAGITGAMAAFVYSLDTRHRVRSVAVMAASLTLAQFTKGPVGLAVPLLAVAGALWIGRRHHLHGTGNVSRMAIAAAISLLLFGLWAIPANLASGGLIVRQGLGREVIGRMFSAMEGHGGNFVLFLPFYFLVVAIGFFPWTLYLLGALWSLLCTRDWQEPARAVLLGWIVLPFAFFTVAATKLPHYILPIWPPLALAVAHLLDARSREPATPRVRVWVRRGRWLWILTAACALALLVAGIAIVPAPGFRLPAGLVGLLIVVSGVLGLRREVAGGYRESAASLVVCGLVTQLLVAAWLAPSLEVLKPVPKVAAAVRQRSSSAVPVATFGFEEPSLDFYLNRPPVGRLGNPAILREWAGNGTPGILVTTRALLTATVRQGGPLPLAELASASGFNSPKGQWIELVALRKVPVP